MCPYVNTHTHTSLSICPLGKDSELSLLRGVFSSDSHDSYSKTLQSTLNPHENSTPLGVTCISHGAPCLCGITNHIPVHWINIAFWGLLEASLPQPCCRHKGPKSCESVCLEAGTLCSLLAFENSSDAQSDTHWLGKVGTIAKMGQFYVKYTNTTSSVIWSFVDLWIWTQILSTRKGENQDG